MSFKQFLYILKARWVTMLVMFVVTIAGTLAVSMTLPKKYTSSASVLIDVRATDPVAGIGAIAGAMSPAYMATQVDIISSDRVAQRVVRNLRLNENAESRAAWQAENNGASQLDYDTWISAAVKKNLEVRPSRESNVISVSYTATDPKFAAALANAFTKSYLDTTLELRVNPARQYSEFFDERAKVLRENVEAAQTRLSTYQKKHGIIAIDERFDVENQRLNELNSQLVTIQAIAAESNSRSAQASTSGAQLQDVINNPVVAGLRSDLSRQEARLQELNSRLGEAHPQVAELKANIAELKIRIEAESRRVTTSVSTNGTINRSRETEIRNALESQRVKVLKMKEQRDEIMVLTRDVDAAQRTYEAVVSRLNQTTLESQNSQTNISVLTPATPALEPSSPRTLFNLLLAVAGGSILALSTALLRELLDRRVRTLSDLSESIGVPVLGHIPKSNRRGLPGDSTKMLLPSNILRRLPNPIK